MKQKLNNYIISSIVSSVIFGIFGIIVMIFPQMSLTIFSYMLSITLIVLGLYLVWIDFNSCNRFIPIDTAFSGILMVIFGIVMVIHPSTLSFIIPITLGIYFIFSGIIKFRLSMSLRGFSNGNWILSLIISILSLICGLIFIFRPLDSSNVVTSITGLIIVIYAISDIVDMVMFKKYISDIAKFFKKRVIIDEK